MSEPETRLQHDLEEAIGGVGRPRRLGVEAAFRATLEARLRSLEEDLDEVKTRLNGLLFFIATTVVAQVVLKLWA